MLVADQLPSIFLADVCSHEDVKLLSQLKLFCRNLHIALPAPEPWHEAFLQWAIALVSNAVESLQIKFVQAGILEVTFAYMESTTQVWVEHS
jgi:hypothetical protein